MSITLIVIEKPQLTVLCRGIRLNCPKDERRRVGIFLLGQQSNRFLSNKSVRP